jgi:hypothetical protein
MHGVSVARVFRPSRSRAAPRAAPCARDFRGEKTRGSSYRVTAQHARCSDAIKRGGAIGPKPCQARSELFFRRARHGSRSRAQRDSCASRPASEPGVLVHLPPLRWPCEVSSCSVTDG